MTETTWLWTGCIAMALGSVALFVVGKRRTQDEEGHTLIHVLVTMIASLSYLAQATRQGSTILPGGREFLYARYVDWSITTPLLLLGLAMTALHGAHRRPSLVAALLGADVLMIVTGLFYGASEATGPKYIWFIVSCGAFLAVYATLFGPLLREARARDDVRRSAYLRSAVVLAVLWLVYPVVDLLGNNGIQAVGALVTTAVLTVTDLLAKVAYGFLSTHGTSRVAEHDLAVGAIEPAPVSSEAVPSSADPHRRPGTPRP